MKVIVINNNNQEVLVSGCSHRYAKDISIAAKLHYPNSKIRILNN